MEINKNFDIQSQVETLEDVGDTFVKFSNIAESIQNALQEAEIINRREKILKYSKLTDYSSIETQKKGFMPYYKFWQYASDFEYKYPQIFEGPISSIDRDELTKDVMDTWSNLGKLSSNEFKVIPHMNQMCKT